MSKKKYWADYLKHNYLTGSAFTLVENESDYSNLGQAFSLMATHGFYCKTKGDLDTIGGIWKIKGEENITSANCLINAMKDLTALAFEGQLYEGGGLE